MDQVHQHGARVHEPFIKLWPLNHVLTTLIKRTKRCPIVLIGVVNTEMSSRGLFPRRRQGRWVSMATPWPSVVACQSGGWHALRSTVSSGSQLKSKRRSRDSCQGVFAAAAINGRWHVTARLQLLSSAMVGGSSKGWNGLGLHQTSAAQHRQAHQVVTVAQNTVEWWRYAWEQWLGFSSVFTKIPHEGSPIYRCFAPRSCVTRIQPRIYL
jgi:hypothetical protein